MDYHHSRCRAKTGCNNKKRRTFIGINSIPLKGYREIISVRPQFNQSCLWSDLTVCIAQLGIRLINPSMPWAYSAAVGGLWSHRRAGACTPVPSDHNKGNFNVICGNAIIRWPQSGNWTYRGIDLNRKNLNTNSGCHTPAILTDFAN